MAMAKSEHCLEHSGIVTDLGHIKSDVKEIKDMQGTHTDLLHDISSKMAYNNGVHSLTDKMILGLSKQTWINTGKYGFIFLVVMYKVKDAIAKLF